MCVCVCVYSIMSDILQPPNMLSLPTTPSEASPVAWSVKTLPDNQCRLRRSPGEGNGISLQFSCLWNPMDRGSWKTTVHGGNKESGKTWLLNNNTPQRGWDSRTEGRYLLESIYSISLSVGKFCIIFIAKTVLSSLISSFE